MGSKGTQTTTNTNQSYNANPYTQQAAQQALSGAESAASTPFQMPVAPVAGFNATQKQAFGEVQAAQGMAQPYYNQANSYFNQAAQPLSQSAINAYYNPMASNVTAQLQNIYGEQNAQATGAATQTAGGVGADRIGVAQGDLANQQTLAAGQVYSGLYQNALQAAQQQQQNMGQQGSNIAGLGGQAQTAALQGAGALGNSGLQQQQQTQAQLNAPYQNELARIAYQFQTPQYLAGIAGGLAPALGGTTVGQQVVTPPYPTPLAQIAGLGTAGVGLAGAFGAGSGAATYGGGSAIAGDANGGTSAQPLPGLTAADYGVGYARGGNVEGFDEGGGTQAPAMPGSTVPAIGGSVVPYISMPMGAGHSSPLTGGINFPSPTSAPAATNSLGSDISAAMKLATAAAPFLKRGGSIDPPEDSSGPRNMPPWLRTKRIINDEDNIEPYPHYDSGGGTNTDDPLAGSPPTLNQFTSHLHNPAGYASNPFPDMGGGTIATPAAPAVTEPPVNTDSGKTPFPAADPRKTGAVKIASQHTGHSPTGGAGTTDVSAYAEPNNAMPYPNLHSDMNSLGQNMARSPWMALVNAGAAMMSTPGNFGTSLGKGLQAGVGALDKQRTELRSDQELNDKAQALYQTAQTHLDKYNKLTAAEKAHIGLKNRELDQSEGGEEGGIKPMTGNQRAALYSKISETGLALGWDKDKIDQEYNRRLSVAHGHIVPHTASPPPTKEFDDGKGGKVIGYWNGTTYAPKAP